MNFPHTYLASGSPRRRELLSQIGVDFSVVKVDVDEAQLEDEVAVDYVRRVAIAKAQAGFQQHELPSTNGVVLGADTSVIVDAEILGKPKDDDDSRRMLQLLSGRSHQVLTAVAAVTVNDTQCVISDNVVQFAELSADEINWYIATQEGIDKAGSYAVQGQAAIFIEQIIGSYSGIMGLPVRETAMLLKKISG